MSLFSFEGMLFFILHADFSQISSFVRRLQASFLLGLKVQDSLDELAKFLVYCSPLNDLSKV